MTDNLLIILYFSPVAFLFWLVSYLYFKLPGGDKLVMPPTTRITDEQIAFSRSKYAREHKDLFKCLPANHEPLIASQTPFSDLMRTKGFDTRLQSGEFAIPQAAPRVEFHGQGFIDAVRKMEQDATIRQAHCETKPSWLIPKSDYAYYCNPGDKQLFLNSGVPDNSLHVTNYLEKGKGVRIDESKLKNQPLWPMGEFKI